MLGVNSHNVFQNYPLSKIELKPIPSFDYRIQNSIPNDINAIYSGGGGRTYYFNNGGSIYWGYGSGDIHQFRNSANNAVFYISSSGVLTMGNNVWHKDLTGGERLYFSPNAQTYVKGHGTSPIEFRNGVDSTILKISSTGVLDTYNNIIHTCTRLSHSVETN